MSKIAAIINGLKKWLPTTGTPAAVAVREASGKITGITGGTGTGEVLVQEQLGTNYLQLTPSGTPIFAQLVVKADGGTGITAARYSTNTGGPNFTLQKARGTNAAPLDAVAGDVVFNLLGQGYDALAFRTALNLQGRLSAGFGGGDSPGLWAFQTTPVGSYTQRDVILFDDAGNIQFVFAATLNVAATDVVSMVGVDRINTRHAAAGNRLLALQSERGSPVYLGDDALDFAATTGVVSVNGADILSLTSIAATLAGNLFLTGTLPYIDIKPSAWANSGYLQFGVTPSFAGAGNYAGIYVPAGKGISFAQAGTTLFLMDVGGNVSFGTGSTTPLAKCESRSTTDAQFLASYDASNYVKIQCGSTGIATISGLGAAKSLVISDPLTIGGQIKLTQAGTLNPAATDTVSIVGVDNGAGNREHQVQPENGGFHAYGADVWRRVPTANNNVDDRIKKITTTDATVTTVDTIAITANSTYLIKTRIIGRRTGGVSGTADDGCSYERKATYTTKAGVVTLMGAVETIGTDREDQAGFDVTLTISGTNVLIRFTGAAGNNMSVQAHTIVERISS